MKKLSDTLDSDKGQFAATVGFLGAVLASSCCVIPLILVSLGVSGAWIGTLNALDPYKEYLAAISLMFLAAGFRQVYRKKTTSCADESFCANPISERFTKPVLWIATTLIIVALTTDWWAPFFY